MVKQGAFEISVSFTKISFSGTTLPFTENKGNSALRTCRPVFEKAFNLSMGNVVLMFRFRHSLISDELNSCLAYWYFPRVVPRGFVALRRPGTRQASHLGDPCNRAVQSPGKDAGSRLTAIFSSFNMQPHPFRPPPSPKSTECCLDS